MVRAKGLSAPADYVVSGAWPHARLRGPKIVEYAQEFAARLEAAMIGRGVREVARAAELSHSTILAVTAGERWPDMVTIAKLEELLEVALWPGPEIRARESRGRRK